MKNKKINYVIIFLISAVVLYFTFKDNFSEKVKYLLSVSPFWLIISLLLMIIYWILKGLVLYYCIKKIDKKYTKKEGIYLMVTTQFFHSITPFASGGQPWQVYKLKKRGLTIGEGTNIAIEDFIAYQLALILLGIVAVIANHIFHIIPSDNSLRYLTIIGFSLNILVIIILFLVAFNKKCNKILINVVIKILHKIKIIKNLDKQLEKSEQFISNFHESAEVLFKDKINLIRVVSLNFIALIFQYSIPFTLLLGLNTFVNPFYIVVTSAYVMLIDSMIPTPGSTGGLEFGFMSFFSNFIKGSKLSIVMIVWRIVTYYFGIITGLIALNIHKEEVK